MGEEVIPESASTVVKKWKKGSHEFVVEKDSLRKGIGVNKSIQSQQFMVGEHLWTILFYPDGRSVDDCNAGYSSLFIRRDSVSTTPLYCFLDFYILDQSGKANHLCHSWRNSDSKGHQVSYLTGNYTISGYNHFIKKASLESYLKDDCIKISVTITIPCVQTLPQIEVPPSNIGADMGKLLKGKRGPRPDVFFKIGPEGEIFGAHKSILAIRSPVFKSLVLYKDVQVSQKEIIIRDVEPRVFKAMLWFVYTGSLPKEDEDDEQEGDLISGELIVESFMGKMVALADQFKLKRLKEICESWLMDRISEESTKDLLNLAYVCHATRLEAACLRFEAQTQPDGSEARPLLFPDVAPESSTSHGKGEVDFRSKILSGAKKSFAGMVSRQKATDHVHEYQKMKEV